MNMNLNGLQVEIFKLNLPVNLKKPVVYLMMIMMAQFKLRHTHNFCTKQTHEGKTNLNLNPGHAAPPTKKEGGCHWVLI